MDTPAAATFLTRVGQAFACTTVALIILGLAGAVWVAQSAKNARERGDFALTINEKQAIDTLTPERFTLPQGRARTTIALSDISRQGARLALATTSLSDPVLCAVDPQGGEHLLFVRTTTHATRTGTAYTHAIHPITTYSRPGLCTEAVEAAYARARAWSTIPLE